MLHKLRLLCACVNHKKGAFTPYFSNHALQGELNKLPFNQLCVDDFIVLSLPLVSIVITELLNTLNDPVVCLAGGFYVNFLYHFLSLISVQSSINQFTVNAANMNQQLCFAKSY